MSKSEKQAFLRTQIKDQGYDRVKFIKFLDEDEDKEYELDNWTMEELHSAVKEFIRQEEDADDNESVSSTDTDAMGEVFGKEPAPQSDDEESSSSEEEDQQERDFDPVDELTGAFDMDEPEQ